MKKITAIILVAILISLTSAPALAKTVYDPEKLHFIIVAIEEETHDTYMTEVTYKTVVNRVMAGLVYEVYMLEADGLVPVDFAIIDGSVILTSRITGETVTQ